MDTKKIVLVMPAILLLCIMLSSCSSQEIEISEDVKECVEEKSQTLTKHSILDDLRSGHQGTLEWTEVEFDSKTSLAEAKEILESYGLEYSVLKFPDEDFYFMVDLKNSFPKKNDTEIIKLICRLNANEAVESTKLYSSPTHAKLSFPTARIAISVNKSWIREFWIRNTKNSDMKFCVAIEEMSKLPEGEECDSPLKPANSSLSDHCGGFYWDPGVHSLEPGESKMIWLKYFAPAKMNRTYLYRLRILTEDGDKCLERPDSDAEEYASKSLFVRVK